MIQKLSGPTHWFFIKNFKSHISYLKAQGFKEITPRSNGEVRFLNYKYKYIGLEKIRKRIFIRVSKNILAELQEVVDSRRPYVRKIEFLTENGKELLEIITKDLRIMIAEYKNAFFEEKKLIGKKYADPKKIKQKEFWTWLSSEKEYHSIESELNNKLEDLESILNCFRIYLKEGWYYNLDIGRSRGEVKVYLDFLMAVREANGCGPWTMSGDGNPEAGQPPKELQNIERMQSMIPFLEYLARKYKSDPGLISDFEAEFHQPFIRKFGAEYKFEKDLFSPLKKFRSGVKKWAKETAHLLIFGYPVGVRAVNSNLKKIKKGK